MASKVKKPKLEDITATQEKLDKIGESLGIIDKVVIDKVPELNSIEEDPKYANVLVLKDANHLDVLIEDFNLMRSILKENIAHSKELSKKVSASVNPFAEDGGMGAILAFTNLQKIINESTALLSNLHKTLAQIVEKSNKSSDTSKEAQKNTPEVIDGEILNIAEVTRGIRNSQKSE